MPTRKIRPRNALAHLAPATSPTSPRERSTDERLAARRASAAPGRGRRRRAGAGGASSGRQSRTRQDAATMTRITRTHASASRNTSDSRRRSKTNSVTGPAAMAAAQHRLACRRRRRAPAGPRRPRPRTPSTPGSARAHAPSRSPSTRTTSRRAPLVVELVDAAGRHQAPVVDDRRPTRTGPRPGRAGGWRSSTHAPGAGLLDQHLADGVDAGRVEPGQRLVEDEQLGLVDQRGRQLDPLLVAVRERLDLVVGPVGHARAARATSLWPPAAAAAALIPCSRPRYSTCSPTSMPG